MAVCSFCSNEVPDGMQQCPHCHTEIAVADVVYDLSGTDAEIPPNWQTSAVYTLEMPARCPHCREPIRTLRVLRLSRTQAAFTSTLPRGGRVMACPQCETILSVELSTFS